MNDVNWGFVGILAALCFALLLNNLWYYRATRKNDARFLAARVSHGCSIERARIELQEMKQEFRDFRGRVPVTPEERGY